MSTTLGPRGASINLGARGAHLNLGLPGTGISYRAALSGHTSSSPSEGSALFVSPRAAARRRRQEEREALRGQAEDLQAEREAHLAALQDILRNRERDPIDWEQEYAAAGPYVPRPFATSMEPVSRELVTKEVVSANPLRPWLLTSVSGMLGAALAPQLWMRVPMMLLGAYMLVQAILVYRGRRVETNRVVDEREAQLEDDLAAARAAHEAEEEDRAHQHEQEELLRARLRNAEGQDDVEIVALALEIELSNEDLPIPVVYEVEFDGVRRVTIRLDLPTLEAIPPTRSRVTKSGTFSERPMALRDRISLYQDVCAGLALRLVHEVYRVLPFMQSVELTGVAERLSPATGHPERYPALRLATTRGRLLTINLDDVDPSQALQGLGGQLTTTREGVLKAVDPEHG